MAAKQNKTRSKKRSNSKNGAAQVHLLFIERVLKVLVAVSFSVLIAIVGYFYGYQTAQNESRHALTKKEQEKKKVEQILQKYQLQSAAHEYDKTPPKEDVAVLKKEEPKVELRAKPLMAIIVDDVSFAHDIRNIEALDIPVTMSFLPPSSRHPHSAELARDVSGYMVHLPLQAKHFNHEEPDTLHVGDSEEKIEKRIMKIAELYPRVRYVNNHTGSLFTEDTESMRRLINVLDRYGITFVDSRTTGKTVLPALMKSLHRPYISRDVFLDHAPDIDSVKKQIAHAVNIAKKYGYVIAICHPHKNTLEGIKESKELLKQVQLVQIDTLVQHLRK
jgi:polysaccharide deacetylase 2 family uncharacterized protein YibQ